MVWADPATAAAELAIGATPDQELRPADLDLHSCAFATPVLEGAFFDFEQITHGVSRRGAALNNLRPDTLNTATTHT